MTIQTATVQKTGSPSCFLIPNFRIKFFAGRILRQTRRIARKWFRSEELGKRKNEYIEKILYAGKAVSIGVPRSQVFGLELK